MNKCENEITSIDSKFKCYKRLVNNGKTEYKCSVCNKNYKLSSSVTGHYFAKHTTRFKCNINNCNKCFASNSCLKVHMGTHATDKEKEKAKRFKCQYCDKGFAHLTGCKIHERIHTGEKTTICCNEQS